RNDELQLQQGHVVANTVPRTSAEGNVSVAVARPDRVGIEALRIKYVRTPPICMQSMRCVRTEHDGGPCLDCVTENRISVLRKARNEPNGRVKAQRLLRDHLGVGEIRQVGERRPTLLQRDANLLSQAVLDAGMLLQTVAQPGKRYRRRLDPSDEEGDD